MALRAELRQSLHELRNGVLDLQGRAAHFLPLDKEGRRVLRPITARLTTKEFTRGRRTSWPPILCSGGFTQPRGRSRERAAPPG